MDLDNHMRANARPERNQVWEKHFCDGFGVVEIVWLFSPPILQWQGVCFPSVAWVLFSYWFWKFSGARTQTDVKPDRKDLHNRECNSQENVFEHFAGFGSRLYLSHALVLHVSLLFSRVCSVHSSEQTRRLRFHDMSTVNALIVYVSNLDLAGFIHFSGLEDRKSEATCGEGHLWLWARRPRDTNINRLVSFFVLEVVGNQGLPRSRTRGTHFGANATKLAKWSDLSAMWSHLSQSRKLIPNRNHHLGVIRCANPGNAGIHQISA